MTVDNCGSAPDIQRKAVWPGAVGHPGFSPIKMPSPQLSYIAAGGLLLGQIFQWPIPTLSVDFLLHLDFSVLLWGSPEITFSLFRQTDEHRPLTCSALTQACLEQLELFHFAFPIAKSWDDARLLVHPVLLSTSVSPFLFWLYVTISPGTCQWFLVNFYNYFKGRVAEFRILQHALLRVFVFSPVSPCGQWAERSPWPGRRS